MPPRGVVNNPSGVNSFSGPGGDETPYGAVKRLVQSVRAAPIGTNPAINEPRRSKKRAVSGQAQPEPHPLNQPPPVEQDPESLKAEFWQYLASLNQQDAIVQELAAPYTGNTGPASPTQAE